MGQVWLRSAFARALATAFVNFLSGLDRSLFCFKSALVKNKMATLNEHTSVVAAILSDISDHSDANFIYIGLHVLSENKCQQQIRKNDGKNTSKQTKHQTKSQFVYKQTHESRD